MQQVPTSPAVVSAPNPSVSHTGRSEFKHHLTHVSEKFPHFPYLQPRSLDSILISANSSEITGQSGNYLQHWNRRKHSEEISATFNIQLQEECGACHG
jgi:hypothetical protein